jgi:hypothetical protein
LFKDSLSIPDKQSLARSETSSSNAEKLTKLWALSESMLGGVLHAVKMPFRGMILSGAAVILIGMLANFSEKRGQIFRSTVLVVTIKATVSPHSPLTAYLSVFMQGLLGELFFLSENLNFFLLYCSELQYRFSMDFKRYWFLHLFMVKLCGR